MPSKDTLGLQILDFSRGSSTNVSMNCFGGKAAQAQAQTHQLAIHALPHLKTSLANKVEIKREQEQKTDYDDCFGNNRDTCFEIFVDEVRKS